MYTIHSPVLTCFGAAIFIFPNKTWPKTEDTAEWSDDVSQFDGWKRVMTWWLWADKITFNQLSFKLKKYRQ